ncbi:hypothetical protein EYF80_036842 [Liparis tanakae]|uniref:Uncharacterized protein n=1 Tax=Liparis tanakae TaxID=230148 RepID=A0A4Z2GHE1_9TELE|nr:hypothetical protein EYF80_036842 [Liparis tanakae]
MQSMPEGQTVPLQPNWTDLEEGPILDLEGGCRHAKEPGRVWEGALVGVHAAAVWGPVVTLATAGRVTAELWVVTDSEDTGELFT